MLVSIIIPAFNAEATLGRCMKACLNQTYQETEVLVVDDGSTDDTPRIAQSYPVHYIRQENRGPAAARNRGARDARGEVVAFTDSDCIPQTTWIERLVAGFEEDVAGVGGTYAIANGEHLLARMIHEEIRARHKRFDADVDFLGSFNVVYRKKAFEAVGGFDEDFTDASGEDNDLAYRLHDMGGKLRFVDQARVAHVYPTRTWAYLRTQMRHGFWRMKLYKKHPGRASGDRYARGPELIATGMPEILCLGAALYAFGLVAGGPSDVLTALGVTLLALSVAYLAIRLWLPIAMVKNTGDPRMLLMIPVAFMRDVARTIGMKRGWWWFRVRGKDTR